MTKRDFWFAIVTCGALLVPTLRFGQSGADQDSGAAEIGGVARVHVAVLPSSLNLALGSSSVGRGIHVALHETLIGRNSETLEMEPNLCRDYVVEDSLILAASSELQLDIALAVSVSEEGARQRVLYGKIERKDDGYRVTPLSAENPLREVILVPFASVDRVERGTVFTLHLRDDVLWHDGHQFDAGDVMFSWEIYANPHVNCDARRFQYKKIVRGDRLDPLTVRFVYESQYFKSIDALAALCLLPSHLYNLQDSDHSSFDPEADELSRAEEINENAHNRDWIGLGPYRLVEWVSQSIRAERFEDYFDSERGGYMEEVWWRTLTSDAVLRAALAEGILDFTDRLTPDLEVELREDDYFASYYTTGHFHRGRYGFIAWNLRRAELSQPAARRALAHAFDFDRFNTSQYDGLAVRVTGPQNRLGRAYDQDVRAPAFDLELAEELLATSGWIDRDGDGILDREGLPFEIELLLPAGNRSGERVATVLQEGLARVGVTLTISQLDLAALLARVRERDFDAVLLAWTQPLESDPEQKWHSRLADSGGSSNFGGLADTIVDRLIERGQSELDSHTRFETWRELHRRLDQLQPYLFLFDAPSFYALDAGVRGFRSIPLPPNYRLREWFRNSNTSPPDVSGVEKK